jgi:hypothetical protein
MLGEELGDELGAALGLVGVVKVGGVLGDAVGSPVKLLGYVTHGAMPDSDEFGASEVSSGMTNGAVLCQSKGVVSKIRVVESEDELVMKHSSE